MSMTGPRSLTDDVLIDRISALAAATRETTAELFVGITGHRCEERLLEYHHLKPWIVGGEATAENIALRCHAHNQYESTVYFAPIRRAMNSRS